MTLDHHPNARQQGHLYYMSGCLQELCFLPRRRASAGFMISSPLMTGEYERQVPDYANYKRRMTAAV